MTLLDPVKSLPRLVGFGESLRLETFREHPRQAPVGMNNTDTVSRINSVWGYQGEGKWNPWEVEYSTFLVKHPGEAINTQIGK